MVQLNTVKYYISHFESLIRGSSIERQPAARQQFTSWRHVADEVQHSSKRQFVTYKRELLWPNANFLSLPQLSHE